MPPVEEWETSPFEGDILPPVPEKIWRENAEAVAAALRE